MIHKSRVHIIFLTLYRWLISPLLLFLAVILATLGHKKIRRGLKMRATKHGKTPWSKYKKNQKPIWIHCSSGEFEYAKPVIRELKKTFPEIPIMVTYFSPTYQSAVDGCSDVDMSGPLPWDLPGPISNFIGDHSPRALLIARTDLWPELLHQCRSRSIPTLLFSATQKKSMPYFSWIIKAWLFRLLTDIYCVAEADQQVIARLAPTAKISMFGDTRYDQVVYRINNPNETKESLFSGKNILLGGSTWNEDESILIPSAAPYLKNGELHLIIAPHEPTEEHLLGLERRIAAEGLVSQRYTQAESWTDEEVLIIDCIGILADLYKYSNIALIGGSFKNSVHSVMEGLVTGNPIIVGPAHKNNREAIEFQNVRLEGGQHYAVSVANGGEQLKALLNDLVDNKSLWPKWHSEIHTEVQKKLGASRRVVEWISANTSL